MSLINRSAMYNLYSCTSLSEDNIKRQLDCIHDSGPKIIKYTSKPNPTLTINSLTAPTEVFLSPRRSVLKTSNKLENGFFQRNGFSSSESSNSKFVYSSLEDTEEEQMLPSETSTSDEFDFNHPDTVSRRLPNILKTKSNKLKDNLKQIKTQNENNSNKEKISRKRKQTYNLPKFDEDLSLFDSKERVGKSKQKKRAKLEEIYEEKQTNQMLNTEENKRPKKEPKAKKKTAKKAKVKKVKKEKSTKKDEIKVDGSEAMIEAVCEENSTSGEIKFCKRKLEEEGAIDDVEKKKQKKKHEEESAKKTENEDDIPKIEDVRKLINKEVKIMCARVCPFVSNQQNDKTNDNKSVLSEGETFTDHEIDTDLVQLKNDSTLWRELPSKFQTENKNCSDTSMEALLGLEHFKEYYSDLQNHETEVNKLPFPVDGEFLTPDYWTYLERSNLSDDLDDIHKLIISPLCADFADGVSTIAVAKATLDVNGNIVKVQNSKFLNIENKFAFNAINDINPANKGHHFGVRDSLINGCNSIDYDSAGIDDNCQNSNSSFSDSQEEDVCLNSNIQERKLVKPRVFVDVNKKFLSCAHLECYDEMEVETHNPFVPDIPKNFVPNEEIDHNDEMHTDRFKCPKCNIIFGKRRTLALHESKAHLGFYSYSCNRCSMLCNSKIQLQRHYTRCIPDSKKAFVCTICKKKYSYQSSLKQHLKNKHLCF